MSPSTFETNPHKIENVLASLNSLNQLILKSGNGKKKNIFHFSLNDKKQVTFQCKSDSFCLFLSPHLAQVLGFRYRLAFYGKEMRVGSRRIPGKRNLNTMDYAVSYIDFHIQKYLRRIIIKSPNISWNGRPETFIEMWNDTVRKHVDIRAKFKGNKLVIDNFEGELSIIFSQDFGDIFSHHSPICGKETRWGLSGFRKRKDYDSASWYIDIYTKQRRVKENREKPVNLDVTCTIFPWSEKSIEQLIQSTNTTVAHKLKEELGYKYDSSDHKFMLSLQTDNHCLLRLGKRISVTFSENLSPVFGFYDDNLRFLQKMSNREYYGDFPKKRELIYVLSNIIKPAAFGSHRIPILQRFLHKHKKPEEQMIEKRFSPMTYLPLMSNFVDKIDIQLTNEMYQPITFPDSKTLVCLYFRKV